MARWHKIEDCNVVNSVKSLTILVLSYTKKTCYVSSEAGKLEKKYHADIYGVNVNISLIQFLRFDFQPEFFNSGRLVESFLSEVAPSGVVPRSLPPPTSDPHELKVVPNFSDDVKDD